MKRLSGSPYFGLVMTGIVASLALLIEPRLPTPLETHYFLQFVWVGVLGAALLAFSLTPALTAAHPNDPPQSARDDDSPAAVTPEFFDADRGWLQTHSDASWNEQV